MGLTTIYEALPISHIKTTPKTFPCDFFKPGRQFEFGSTKYLIECVLGCGNQAIALRARKLDDTVVTLRICERSADDDQNARLLEEIAIQKLEHPFIQRCLNHVEGEIPIPNSRGQPTMTPVHIIELQYIDDELEKLHSQKRLSEAQIEKIIVQLCCAIAFLHKQWVVHRDIKLQNVFVTAQGVAKLSDFGFARQLAAAKLMTAVGTPGYVAPEVWEEVDYDEEREKSLAQYSGLVDEWSLGVLCYHLLTRELPFKTQTLEQLKQLDGKIAFEKVQNERLRKLVQGFIVFDITKRKSVVQVIKENYWKEVVEMGRETDFE